MLCHKKAPRKFRTRATVGGGRGAKPRSSGIWGVRFDAVSHADRGSASASLPPALEHTGTLPRTVDPSSGERAGGPGPPHRLRRQGPSDSLPLRGEHHDVVHWVSPLHQWVGPLRRASPERGTLELPPLLALPGGRSSCLGLRSPWARLVKREGEELSQCLWARILRLGRVGQRGVHLWKGWEGCTSPGNGTSAPLLNRCRDQVPPHPRLTCPSPILLRLSFLSRPRRNETPRPIPGY